MKFEAKIRALNKVLAMRLPNDADKKFEESSRIIELALASGANFKESLEDFSKTIIKIYDRETRLEFIDLGEEYFAPLFLIEKISDATKRLAGEAKALIVVSGLDKSTLGKKKRWSEKKRQEYLSNLDVVENYILRYKSSMFQIEIVFI